MVGVIDVCRRRRSCRVRADGLSNGRRKKRPNHDYAVEQRSVK